MHSSKVLLLFTAISCAANAFPAYFPSLLKATKRGAFPQESQTYAVVQSPLVRALSKEQKCDRLTSAFQELINAVNTNLGGAQAESIREQLLQTTGMDMSDPSHVRKEACKTASISSLADFADKAGVSPAVMADFYPSFVSTINQVRALLRDSLNSSYLSKAKRQLVRATLNFYNALADIGLLSLS